MSGLPVLMEVTPLAVDLSGLNLTFVAVVGVIAVVALVMAVVFRREVLAASEGTENMQRIALAVQEGASAYLARQFRTLAVFAVIAFIALLLLPVHGDGGFGDWALKISRSIAFLVGAVFSALIGYMGMWLAVRANLRVASAARSEGRNPAMRIAFRTGAHVGMATVGLGLLGASVVVLVFRSDAPTILEGFGFGAAMLAMFMRVGGGIFTKAADVGADLVGKVEQNIPEDDPRNAATIADNVGDNVGDCAGMAADLFESYAVTLVASLILGKAAFGAYGLVFPLIVPAIGVITAIIGIYLTKPREGENGLRTINRSFYLSAVISAVLCAIAAFAYLPSSFDELGVDGVTAGPVGDPRLVALGSVVIGIVLAAIILSLTGYYTGTEHRPVKDVGKTSLTGAATVVLSGIAVGFESSVYTAVVIAAAVFGAFLLGGSGVVGLFAIALAGCGLLTTVGVIVAMDTFGPVSDNAQGIAEMSGDVDGEGAKILTELDAVGNTTKAITKGIAISTAVLAATALFGSYTDSIRTVLGENYAAVRRRGGRVLPGHPGRHHPRCRGGVPVLRSGRPGGRAGRRCRRVRGAAPVPGDPGDHGGHRQARVRQGRRHLHARLAAGAGHARSARAVGPDRRGLRARRPGPGRLPGRGHRCRHPDGGLPGQLRWRLGQRQEAGRGRQPRRQGIAGPRGHRHRRHRRRPVQGHRRPGHQPADQGDEPGGGADRPGGGDDVPAERDPVRASLRDRAGSLGGDRGRGGHHLAARGRDRRRPGAERAADPPTAPAAVQNGSHQQQAQQQFERETT